MAATTTVQRTSNAITIKGSVKFITDYLNYGIHSILFQRGIYPPEMFRPQEHFGISVYVNTDPKIQEFLDAIFSRMQEWLKLEQIERLALVITNVSTKEPIERWDFKIEYEARSVNGVEATGQKDTLLIQREIKDVLRQICSTVSFLPLLDCPCAFDLHIYANADCEVPDDWAERAPTYIANSEELQLKSFSTSIHKVKTIVSYKTD